MAHTTHQRWRKRCRRHWRCQSFPSWGSWVCSVFVWCNAIRRCCGRPEDPWVFSCVHGMYTIIMFRNAFNIGWLRSTVTGDIGSMTLLVLGGIASRQTSRSSLTLFTLIHREQHCRLKVSCLTSSSHKGWQHREEEAWSPFYSVTTEPNELTMPLQYPYQKLFVVIKLYRVLSPRMSAMYTNALSDMVE